MLSGNFLTENLFKDFTLSKKKFFKKYFRIFITKLFKIFGRQGYGVYILQFAGNFVHRLAWEGMKYQQSILHGIISACKEQNFQNMDTNEE